MNPRVTVIVPTYNSEKYIEKCIETVNAQTFKEYEMLIINDGSTDNTLKIIEEKAKKYSWLRVITIENHGQGYARNLGIKEAKGDYILFLDSDDLLKPETLEKTIKRIEQDKSDLVMFDWMRYSPDTNEYKKASKKTFFDVNLLQGEDCIRILELKAYYTVASLYTKKFLQENNIRYAEGHIYEDNVFIVLVATRAQKISILTDPLYIVVSNDESDTKTSYDTDKHSKAYIEAIKECEKALKSSKYEPSMYYLYYIYALNKFFFYLKKRIPKKEKNMYITNFVNVMSTQEIDYSKYKGKSKILEYIVENNIFKNKEYKKFKRLILKRKLSSIKKRIKRYSKKIANILKKLKNAFIVDRYLKYSKKKVIDNWVFIQSKNSSDLAGNMFYIAQELNENYKDYKVYLACNNKSKTRLKMMLKKYNLTKIKLTNIHTLKYYKLLGRAKFLFTDTSVSKMYIKRKDQILINTWHGTPLKKMGRDVPYRLYDCWNVQKNFIICDYLLYPNRYMKEAMLNAYGIRNITNAKILEAGYPRNSIFYNKERRNQIRKEENLGNKQISVYMPTWRGIMTKKENQRQIEEIKGYFDEIDKLLTDNQIIYVKLHVYVKNGIDCTKYKHIKEFPTGYETYDFLNVADILITDYSSVFFDYANSKRKIILFAYDEKEYLNQRGFYIDYHKDLPFEKVYNAKELVQAINNIEVKEYDDFTKKYCEFDEPEAPKHICEFLFRGKKSNKVHIDDRFGKTDKPNIAVYISKENSEETINEYKNIINKFDINKNNYTLFVNQGILKRYVDFVKEIPNNISVLPYKKNRLLTLRERISKIILKNKRNEINSNAMKREANRRFGEFKFDSIINISEDKDVSEMFKNLSKSKVKKTL